MYSSVRSLRVRSETASPRALHAWDVQHVPATISTGESPQQTELAIEQRACLLALDLPAPRVREVERAADLPGAAVRYVEEPPRITAVAATAFGEVEHDATRCTLDLIRGFGAVLPELRDHRAQGSNQI